MFAADKFYPKGGARDLMGVVPYIDSHLVVNYPGLMAGASRFIARCPFGLYPLRSYVPLREHFGPHRS